MKFFDGRLHAKTIEERIVNELTMYQREEKPIPRLGIVQVGDNEASDRYAALKKKLCGKLGVGINELKIPAGTTDYEICRQVKEFFDRPEVSGGIIQLPLPRSSLKGVLDIIPLSKDIDMLSSKSWEQFSSGNFSRMSPVVRALDYFLAVNEAPRALARGIFLSSRFASPPEAERANIPALTGGALCYESKIKTRGLDAVVIGSGDLVGRPVSKFLLLKGAKVRILDSYKTGTKIDCKLLVLSVGEPNLVKGEDICADCSVVDYGSAIAAGKTVGDLDLQSSIGHLGTVSPSPGGMGPLVVRFLLLNLFGI